MRIYNIIMAGCGRLFVPAGSIKCLKSRCWFINPCQFISSRTKKAIEDSILQKKPKKPLTPFFKYLQIMRPNITTEFPHYTTVEVVKAIAKKWADETTDYKCGLHKEYDAEYKEYMNKIIEYEKSITEEDKNKLLILKHKMQIEMDKAKRKNNLKLLGKPKKPPSAFLLYLSHAMKTERHDVPSKAFVQNISAQWKNMTAEDKKTYLTEAAELMAKYYKDKANWEERMIKEGHLEDVSSKSLRRPPNSAIDKNHS